MEVTARSDDEAKRIRAAYRAVAGAHHVIAGILYRLPVPMDVAPLGDTAETAAVAVRAMDTAWELAATEPVGSLLFAQVRDLITDWLTAYELAVAITRHGPARWRLAGIEAAATRIQVTALQAEEQLHIHNLK